MGIRKGAVLKLKLFRPVPLNYLRSIFAFANDIGTD
jgi:hypothetical protein